MDGAGERGPVLGGLALLPALESGLLARVPALPAGSGLPEPLAGMDARRRGAHPDRRLRVDGRLRGDRLREVELSLPALRRAVLPEVRRSLLAPGLAAQPVRSPLHALRPGQVVNRGSEPAGRRLTGELA